MPLPSTADLFAALLARAPARAHCLPTGPMTHDQRRPIPQILFTTIDADRTILRGGVCEPLGLADALERARLEGGRTVIITFTNVPACFTIDPSSIPGARPHPDPRCPLSLIVDLNV